MIDEPLGAIGDAKGSNQYVRKHAMTASSIHHLEINSQTYFSVKDLTKYLDYKTGSWYLKSIYKEHLAYQDGQPYLSLDGVKLIAELGRYGRQERAQKLHDRYSVQEEVAEPPAPIDDSPLNLDDEQRVSTRELAERLGIENPRKVVALIKKYRSEFEKFGRVNLQSAALETKGGLQEVSYVMLNEDQAYFLLTLNKNTPQAVALKQAFVKTFSKMKAHIEQSLPKTDREAYDDIRYAGETVASLSETLGATHPRLAQELIDLTMNVARGGRALPNPESTQWVGVTEIADRLGYKSKEYDRAALGRAVARLFPNDVKKESRLVNGTMRMVNCYPSDLPGIEEAVMEIIEGLKAAQR